MALPFRFIVVDQFDGTVKGTDNEVHAHEFAECDEYYVIDSETGKWLTPFGTEEIEQIEGEENKRLIANAASKELAFSWRASDLSSIKNQMDIARANADVLRDRAVKAEDALDLAAKAWRKEREDFEKRIAALEAETGELAADRWHWKVEFQNSERRNNALEIKNSIKNGRLASLEEQIDELQDALSAYEAGDAEFPDEEVNFVDVLHLGGWPEGCKEALNAEPTPRIMWEASAYRALRATLDPGNDDTPYVIDMKRGTVDNWELDEAMFETMGWFVPAEETCTCE